YRRQRGMMGLKQPRALATYPIRSRGAKSAARVSRAPGLTAGWPAVSDLRRRVVTLTLDRVVIPSADRTVATPAEGGATPNPSAGFVDRARDPNPEGMKCRHRAAAVVSPFRCSSPSPR